MLQNRRQNYHHSKLPNPGELVTLSPAITDTPRESREKWIVESFNLTDSPAWNGIFYSLGIHLATVRSLKDRNKTRTVSGFFIHPAD